MQRIRRKASTLALATAMTWAAACGTGSAAVANAKTTPAVDVSVVPASAEILPGASLSFSAMVAGTVDTSVRWSVVEAGGGTIDAAGRYTAPASSGSYHVAAVSTAVPTATAVAAVTVTPTPVIGVTISPRSAALTVGQAFSFTAVVTGTTAGQSAAVSWSVQEAGGGSVTATGSYTAPAAAGVYHVVARSVADATRSDVATVTVSPASGGAVPAAEPRVGATQFNTVFPPGADGTGQGTIAVSGLGPAVVWWDRQNGASGFDLQAQTANASWSSGVPVGYVIEASGDAGATWSTLVSVAANTYVTWAHPVDLTGYDRVRMRLASATVGGGTGSVVDLAVHDARAGADDFWLFLGDSITSVVFDGALPGGGRFGANVNARLPARWPIALNGGVDGGVMDHYLRTRADPWSDVLHDGTGPLLYPDGAGNPQPLVRKWMQQFPGKFVSIAIGTNDINQISWHVATSAELDTMQAKMERIIGEALAAGKTVIVPTLRWCTTNAYTAANLAAWNDRLWSTILPKYPAVLRGPDVYAASVNHPEWLADGTHPNALGAATTQAAWADWAVATIYTP